MIKEAKGLNSLTLDEQNGSLITYEIRIRKGKTMDHEVGFKFSKNIKEKSKYELADTSYVEESNFIKILRWDKGKYK